MSNEVPQFIHNGNVYVRLQDKSGAWNVQLLGEFVLSTFVGPRPLGAKVHHIDGDRTNNCLSNLQWKHDDLLAK